VKETVEQLKHKAESLKADTRKMIEPKIKERDIEEANEK
jgi:hypothetical protein